VISLAVAAAGWVLLVTRRLRRYPISTTFETPPRQALWSSPFMSLMVEANANG
jgi:hypothetical protein